MYRKQICYYLLILCFTTSSSFAYMMGEDNREKLNNNEQKVAAIKQTGVIRIQDNEFATGIVTGANCDVVLTAGHTAIHWKTIERKGWKKGEIRNNGELTFHLVPKSNNGIKIKLVQSGYENTKNITNDKYDWAILRLTTPAMKQCETLKYLEQEMNCSGKTLMPAFHFDKPNTKLIDRSCNIKNAIDETIIIHDCDTKDGSSGAPILCENEDEINLIGINIGGLTYKAYEDWGVYGKEGDSFRYKKHQNYAVSIHGSFLEALKNELEASKIRATKSKN